MQYIGSMSSTFIQWPSTDSNESFFSENSLVPQQRLFHRDSRTEYTRKDEPQFGALIHTETLAILEDFFFCPSQSATCLTSAGNFVIVIRKELDQNLAAAIMQSLWTKYQILYAIIIFSCADDGVSGFVTINEMI